jgi:hypothetical protein
MHDETDGWIFTDAAHKWMDVCRKLHGSHLINPRVRNVGGYEFGFYGFKEDTCADVHGHCVHGSERSFLYTMHFENIPPGEEKFL